MLVHLLVAVLVSTLHLRAAFAEAECPPWFVSGNNSGSSPQCACSPYAPIMIDCVQKEYKSYLILGHCAFRISYLNDTVVAQCPYVFPQHLFEGFKLWLPSRVDELNSFICTKLNRTVGENTCGRCANGTGPSVTSIGSQCVKCSAVNILYYILLQYLPATIIFLLVLLLRINVTAAPMAHYVLFCNAVTVFLSTHAGYYTIFAFNTTAHKYILRAFLTLNAIWSFDPLYFVSPALCLSPHIEDIDIPYIDTLATLYPFVLLILAYVVIELHTRDFRPIVTLWRPCHRNLVRFRRSWNPHASLVQAFATLFYILYIKLLFLTYVPFTSADFMDENGHDLTKLKVTYIDPTIPFLHHKHIYLMVFSACILIFIVIPPILILMVYPTRLCNRLRSHLSPRLNLALFIFVDTYQGCFKDGTNGTRDYRSVSGSFLAFYLFVLVVNRAAGLLVEVDERSPVILWQLSIIAFIILSVAFAVIRPYKLEVANHSMVCLAALCAVYATLLLNFDTATANRSNIVITAGVVLLSLPHVVFYGYVLYRLRYSLKHCDTNFKMALREWCFGQWWGQDERLALINHA